MSHLREVMFSDLEWDILRVMTVMSMMIMLIVTIIAVPPEGVAQVSTDVFEWLLLITVIHFKKK